MSLDRSAAVAIARDALAKADPETHSGDPERYDPPQWIVDALRSAFEQGVATGRRLEREDTVAAVLA